MSELGIKQASTIQAVSRLGGGAPSDEDMRSVPAPGQPSSHEASDSLSAILQMAYQQMMEKAGNNDYAKQLLECYKDKLIAKGIVSEWGLHRYANETYYELGMADSELQVLKAALPHPGRAEEYLKMMDRAGGDTYVKGLLLKYKDKFISKGIVREVALHDLPQQVFYDLEVEAGDLTVLRNALPRPGGAGGGGPAGVRYNVDCQVAQQLFGAFSPGQVPQSLDRATLTAMLQMPPEAMVIDVNDKFSTQYPSLFAPFCFQQMTEVLYTAMAGAMRAQPDKCWGNLLDGVCSAVADLLGIKLQWDWTEEDDTGITETRLLFYKGLVMMVSEEKRAGTTMQQAVNDLYTTQRGAGAPLYGQLQYIVGMTTSGATIRFHALDLSQPETGVPISEELNTNNSLERLQVVVACINIVRWINTVTHWLPDTVLPCDMLQWVPRNSLHPMYCQVELWLDFSHVRKKYKVHRERAEQLLCVLLSLELLPGSIQVETMKVNDQVIKSPTVLQPLEPDPRQLPESVKNKLLPEWNSIELWLTPVGYVLRSYSPELMYQLTQQLLMLLTSLHQLNFVHRDIKPNNIIYIGEGNFRLIDWELAGFADVLLVLPGVKAWPDDVRLGMRDYTTHDDLLQVAKLIQEMSKQHWTGAQQFAQVLLQAGTTAAHALQQLPNFQHTWSGEGDGV